LTKPTHDAQPRKTALVVAAVFGLIAAWNGYAGRWPMAAGLGGLAGLLLLVGLSSPTWAGYFHAVWMRAARALGFVNSRILLSLMYYGVLTPYGLVSRLGGRDPLNRRGPGRPSYWVPRKSPRQMREQFERLF
jgi:hypothetical protein